MMRLIRCFSAIILLSCAGQAQKPPTTPKSTSKSEFLHTSEAHFAALEQLTQGGENAEAYWSNDGKELVFQARPVSEGSAGQSTCDRIFRLPLETRAPVPLSSGEGATTCSYFLPGDQEVIFASTHLGGKACPDKPDHSQGYVWALYPSYDIFKAKRDGTGLVRLTETPGYDAEATVCKRDGSILFTSVRDGDIDLYRMDKDGKNVKRLTQSKGYDGGAFFNDDCTQIVWRASRPRPGQELEDYERLLGQNLVRPSKLELYVANADGSEARQITYLDAASFGPYFYPSGKRIVFSSNYGDPKGREFDLWAVNTDGTELERITRAPGFDGFPMFSPDGKRLVFASNRATPTGKQDTNLFLAEWSDDGQRVEPRPEDGLKASVAWLADAAREGRGVGTKGLEAAAAYIEERFAKLGLEPAGDGAMFRQGFDAPTGSSVQAAELHIAAKPVPHLTPLPMSSSVDITAPLVFAGYGIFAPELGHDDYKGKNVKGKIVLVRRFVPEREPFKLAENERRHGDLRKKAFEAKQRGALALLVVDLPEGTAELPKEAPLPTGELANAGIGVAMLAREDIAPIWKGIDGKAAKLRIEVVAQKTRAENIVARLRSNNPDLPPLVIGAHYDHLGFGGRDSLEPESNTAHVGADDNASGVAALLFVAETLSAQKEQLERDVIFVAFSAEELGVLGSTHFVRAGKKAFAMLNMDMVGRLRGNALTVLGGDSAGEWSALVAEQCEKHKVQCTTSGDGYGPSDQTPFYGAGSPVLHFFTGAHSQYHKPSDTADRLNYAGLARIGAIVSGTALAIAKKDRVLTYKARAAQAAPMFGDRRSFGASLGTVPDYAGPPNGQKGVLLSGVRSQSAADKAGLRRGDVLVKLGRFDIGSVEDLMFALTSSKPGETVKARVVREGKETELSATFEARAAR